MSLNVQGSPVALDSSRIAVALMCSKEFSQIPPVADSVESLTINQPPPELSPMEATLGPANCHERLNPVLYLP